MIKYVLLIKYCTLILLLHAMPRPFHHPTAPPPFPNGNTCCAKGAVYLTEGAHTFHFLKHLKGALLMKYRVSDEIAYLPLVYFIPT